MKTMPADAPVVLPEGAAASCSAAQMAALARDARRSGQSFAASLAARLACDPPAALAYCARALYLPCFDAPRLQALAPAFEVLPFAQAEGRGVAVGRDSSGTCWVVVEDPFDAACMDWAESRASEPFLVALAVVEDIRAYLVSHERAISAIDTALPGVAGEAAGTDAPVTELSISRIAEDASPVVRLVNSMLYDALKSGASDVHLESDARGMVIKYRIDGALETAGRIDERASAEQVVSRIKVLAELDIAERRVPQDGRLQVRSERRDVDLRISIMPAVHGEDAVIRVLDKRRLTDAASNLSFETLGFDEHTIAVLRRLARQPYGMFLVTGPTGSGKTTTLYAALSEVRSAADKTITIEDPVEYRLDGVVQIPVNEKRGLTFSRGLRSILRHDPDKIMVGEIRDGETGQIAVQAALTGHLVFSTVHANGVFDVMGRMLHIGVDPFNLVSALNGVVAQRLVRVNCPSCLQEDAPDMAHHPARERALLADGRLQRGGGCAHCRGTGYRGRRAIAEVLIFDDELRDAISARASIAGLKAAARARGMRSIRTAGLTLVAEGITTLAEIDRVSFAEAGDDD